MKVLKTLMRLQNYNIFKMQKIKYITVSSVYNELYNIFRATKVSFRFFFDYKTTMKASALTYFTMLSIVPIVALIFAIAKNFGVEQLIQQELLRHLTGQEAVINWIIKLANSLIHKAKSGVLAGIGLIVLFWAVIRLLVNMENAFNDIWHVNKGRNINRKFADYTSIILLSPFILILSTSFTVYINHQIIFLIKIQYIKPIIGLLISITPYLLLWILFSVLYKAMPNTHIRFYPAIISGILAGSLFQIIQWGYVKFQVGVSNLNALYGSFAALPLFMIWVQTSWLIVLFGAHICYNLQNTKYQEFNHEIEKINHRYLYLVSLLVLNYIIKNFLNKNTFPNIEEISEHNALPARLVSIIINLLEDARLIVPTPISDEEIGYLPATDVQQLTIMDVLDKINTVGIYLPLSKSEYLEKIDGILKKIEQETFASKTNILVKDLL